MSDENRWQNDTEDYYNQNYYQSGTQGGAYGGGTGTGGRDDDPKRKYYRKGHTARWAAGIAAAAVLFGIVDVYKRQSCRRSTPPEPCSMRS